MPTVLTLRLPPGKLARVDRRAAELGQDRSSYMRGLIEEDLRKGAATPNHVFASEDLVGCVNTGIKKSDNRTLRRILQKRMRGRYAKHR